MKHHLVPKLLFPAFAALVLACSSAAAASDKKSAGAWPASIKIMAEVADKMHVRAEARERLTAAVTPKQFFKGVADVVRLHEHDTGTQIYILRNFDLIIAAYELQDTYLKPLTNVVDDVTRIFRSVVELTFVPAKLGTRGPILSARAFAEERSQQFRANALAMTLLAYALAESPVGSEEEKHLSATLQTTSADFFLNMQAGLISTTTTVEAALQILKPEIARLIPERRSRLAFVRGLEEARKSLNVMSPFLPSNRLGLPADTKLGWVAYGIIAGVANMAAMHLNAGSANPEVWYLAANSAFAYFVAANGAWGRAVQIRKSSIDLRKSEKSGSLLNERTYHLEPPSPPATAQEVATTFLGRVSESAKLATVKNCSNLFRP